MNCKIKFSAFQQGEDSKDRAFLTAYGTLEKTEKGYVLEYIEPDSEMGKSKSKIHIFSEKHIHLKREGIYKTSLSIEENKEKLGTYITPYGEMKLSVYGKKVQAQICDLGGKIQLAYSLSEGGKPLSDNELTMEIKILD